MKHLLPQGRKYYRACLHAHTNITDAKNSPEEMKAFYKKRGYSILSITDHNVVMDLSELNEPDFLMLTGAEFNVNEENFQRGCAKSAHFNFIAKRPDLLWQPFRYHKSYNAEEYLAKADIDNFPQDHTTENMNAIIKAANEKGYLVMYNHPHWSLHEYNDYIGLKGLWAMELCNHGSAAYGDRDSGTIYRDLLNQGNRLFAVGADDSHSEAGVAGAWVMVGAEKLAYDSVIDALEKGEFYASTGPEIFELAMDGQELCIRCSDASAITVVCGLRIAPRLKPTAPDKLLREGRIDMSKWFEFCQTGDERNQNRTWFRVIVHGPYGDYAATRAFWFDELQ